MSTDAKSVFEVAYFANVNRAKRSIAVDLSRPEGRSVVLRLCEGADVFTQNYRPGVVERLGLVYDDVAAALDLSIPAVKSLLHRARENLKQRLLPFLHEEVLDEL